MATAYTRAAYQAQQDLVLADNTNRDIDAVDVRDASNDLSESVPFLNGSETITGSIWNFTGSVGVNTAAPEGKLHVSKGSAGAVVASVFADVGIFENSTHGGISILTPDNSSSFVGFGSPSSNLGAVLQYKYDSSLFKIGCGLSGHSLQLLSGASVVSLDIDENQNVAIGNAAIATTATDGFLYIPGSAGPPTGVPTSKTGLVPMHVDSTNNNFYINTGSWLNVGGSGAVSGTTNRVPYFDSSGSISQTGWVSASDDGEKLYGVSAGIGFFPEGESIASSFETNAGTNDTAILGNSVLETGAGLYFGATAEFDTGTTPVMEFNVGENTGAGIGATGRDYLFRWSHHGTTIFEVKRNGINDGDLDFKGNKFIQPSASGAVPVITLDQDDVNEAFINYEGTSAADSTKSISSSTAEAAAKFGAFRVQINGTDKWVRVYDSAV